jgi:nicotinate dehydrogenase subunit A
MSAISLKVNGKLHTLELDPTTPLLFVLADELGLRGPKFGCGMAQCGACAAEVRGQVVRSCVMPLSAVGKDEVTTPGIGTPEKPHPIQQAFIDRSSLRLLPERRDLNGEGLAGGETRRVRQKSISPGGVLCRCFVHVRMRGDSKICRCGKSWYLRREFLQSSGALIVSFSAGAVSGPWLCAGSVRHPSLAY